MEFVMKLPMNLLKLQQVLFKYMEGVEASLVWSFFFVEDVVNLPPHIPPFNNVSVNENKTLSPKKKTYQENSTLECKRAQVTFRLFTKHVVSKSSTQVASHAQKYFIRNQQNNNLSNNKMERRSKVDNSPLLYGKFYPVEAFNFIQTQPFIDEFLEQLVPQVQE
ncbi:hypothetical protein RYX36_006537 [Vicia faba]